MALKRITTKWIPEKCDGGNQTFDKKQECQLFEFLYGLEDVFFGDHENIDQEELEKRDLEVACLARIIWKNRDLFSKILNSENKISKKSS